MYYCTQSTVKAEFMSWTDDMEQYRNINELCIIICAEIELQ